MIQERSEEALSKHMTTKNTGTTSNHLMVVVHHKILLLREIISPHLKIIVNLRTAVTETKITNMQVSSV